jgi:hypothetical protein
MKKTLFAALVALLFVHCIKSDDDTNPTPPEETNPFANCLVTRTERDGFEPHIFSYDNQKRLIKHQYSGYENVLTYSGNTIINTQTLDGNPHYKKTITTNDKGFATKIKLENPNGTWREEVYEYDGTRVVKKSVTTNSSVSPKHTFYQWLDGNMVGETDPDGDITSYTFNTDELFQQGENAGIGELEVGYKIIRNKNRIKSIKSPSGTITNHSYSEDNQGKIIRRQVSSSSGSNYSEKILYTCN